MRFGPGFLAGGGRAAALGLCLAMAAYFCGLAPARAGEVEPAVVGAWLLSQKSDKGETRTIWNIGSDGRFSMRSEGAVTRAPITGVVTFSGGKWSMTADNGFSGGGQYRFEGADRLVVSSGQQSSAYRRIQGSVAADTFGTQDGDRQSPETSDAGRRRQRPPPASREREPSPNQTAARGSPPHVVFEACRAAASCKGVDLSGVKAPGVFLQGGSLQDASLAGADLSGARLISVFMPRVDLTDANLSGATISPQRNFSARFRRTDLSGATIKGCCRGSVFEGPKFAGATLVEADFTGLKAIDGTDFAKANLVGARFSDLAKDHAHTNVSFEGADLTNAVFENFAFGKVSFKGAKLAGARFLRMDLSKAEVSFEGADLTGAMFGYFAFGKVSFKGAKLDGARFIRTDLSQADFGGLDLSKLVTAGSRLPGMSAEIDARHPPNAAFLACRPNCQGADLRGLRMPGQRLDKVKIGNAKLHGADLSGAVIEPSELTGTDLTGAKLRNAWIGRADGARFDGADLSMAFISSCCSPKRNPYALVRKGTEADGLKIGPNTSFAGAVLKGAQADGLRIGAGDSIDGADFSGASLRSAEFAWKAEKDEEKTARRPQNQVRFAGADLAKARFDGMEFVDANFAGANLEEAEFWGAKLQAADFTGANLSKVKVFGASLAGARLKGADLRGMTFLRGSLAGADLEGADLSFATIERADLSSVNLKGARFLSTLFVKVDLSGVSFEGVDRGNLSVIDRDIRVIPVPPR